MQPRLKLLHKTLILVAIPLVFELFFIWQLAQVLKDAEEQAGKQMWAYEVMRESNAVSVAVLAMIKTIASPWAEKQQRPSHEDYQATRTVILNSMDHLLELSKTGGQLSFAVEVRSLDGIINQALSKLDAIEVKLEKGISVPSAESLPLLKIFPELHQRGRQFGVVAHRIIETTEMNRELASTSMRNWLIAGVSFNIALALAVTLAFNRSTTARLRRVVENSRKLAANTELLPLIADGDEVAQLDATFHDMAVALAESRHREQARTNEIEHILRNLPVGLVITDDQGNLLQCNGEFQRMVGRAQTEMQNIVKEGLVIIEGGHVDSFEQLVSSGQGRTAYLKSADGTAITTSLSSNAIGASGGRRYILAFLDMTQKRLLDQARQSFIALVTSELRGPLETMLTFFSKLLKNTHNDMSDLALEHTGISQASTQRMLRLTSDLLDFELLHSGEISIAKRDVSVKSLIERSLSDAAELAKRKRILITSAGEDVTACVDEDRIVQVLVNLVGNGIKFSESGAEVSIKYATLPECNGLQIQVIDNGRGIPAEFQDSIFEKFEQVSDADAKHGHGTGLGLPICKEIVEKHGGTISVSSEPNKGSTFVIAIPEVIVCSSEVSKTSSDALARLKAQEYLQ